VMFELALQDKVFSWIGVLLKKITMIFCNLSAAPHGVCAYLCVQTGWITAEQLQLEVKTRLYVVR